MSNTRKKLQVSAFVGWDVNGTAENAIWDLIRAFNTMKIAEAWTDWHLKNNTKGYDIANYYHANSLEHADIPDEVIEEQIDMLREMEP